MAGYAFIEYETVKDAEDAFQAEANLQLRGESVVLEYAKGPRRSGRDGPPGGGPGCFECGRPGHKARDCRQRGRGGDYRDRNYDRDYDRRYNDDRHSRDRDYRSRDREYDSRRGPPSHRHTDSRRYSPEAGRRGSYRDSRDRSASPRGGWERDRRPSPY
ncbi:hypothetical protein H4R35_005802 [Dimargaris xerosporica]|nr:hypothetical protein H4R35_005802 [Dimargaris xerosporica]